MIKYTRSVARRRTKDGQQVIDIEKHQQQQYKDEQWRMQQENMAIQKEQDNERMRERQTKKRFRVGKMPMKRSAKQSIKKQEQVKVIDPDRQAFLDYLGELGEEDPDDGAPAQK